MLRARILCAVMILLVACAPQIYKDDIATFNTSVDNAVDAFEVLRTDLHADETAKLEGDLAKRSAKVETVGDCTALVTDKLQKDAACLARWASYRATPTDQRGDPPSCPEPARNPTSQELEFYNISATANLETEACRLGVRDKDENVAKPEKLLVGGILENTAQLGGKLKAYADSLANIADAQDSEELRSTVNDAKTALEKLAGRIEELTNEEVPGREAIGPVSELLGAGLIEILETRRFFALKSVVGRAEPVVVNAAKILSRNSMPLMIPKLRTTGTTYLEKTEVFNNGPKDADWIKALADARLAKDSYLELYQGHLTSAFEAMAGAHGALKKALDDPDRQFEALKSAIDDFEVKAKAAYKALVKDGAENTKK